jgi:hypothetical protein
MTAEEGDGIENSGEKFATVSLRYAVCIAGVRKAMG